MLQPDFAVLAWSKSTLFLLFKRFSKVTPTTACICLREVFIFIHDEIFSFFCKKYFKDINRHGSKKTNSICYIITVKLNGSRNYLLRANGDDFFLVNNNNVKLNKIYPKRVFFFVIQ